MSESRTQFPPADLAASAQLAPYRSRLLAFVLDASVLLLVLVVGGLASVLGQYALDFGVSTLTIILLALAVFLGFGVMNATLAYLTDGQTVGKAFCGLVERRRADGPDIGDVAGIGRLMGRHTIGYLVIDVFGLGALATFRLARRRCLHDIPFDTEVVYVGGNENRVLRVKDLDDRRKARLAEMREQWGWAYHLLKWGSGVVIAVVGAVVAALKAVGVLTAAQTSAPSTAAAASVPAATAPSTAVTGVVVGTSAVLTVVAPVAMVSAVDVADQQPSSSSGLAQPQPSVTYSGRGEDVVEIEKPAPISIARIEVTDNQGVVENIIIDGLSADGVEAGSNLLVNEAGNYDGAVLIDPELASRYPTVALAIDPAAGGSWTIEVADILDAPRLVDGSSGIGDEVFLYEGEGGTARIAHEGESNVWVEVFPTASVTNGVIDNYDFVPGVARRVVNEIGDFEGEFGLPPGPSVVYVHAGSFSVVLEDGEWIRPYGEWSISME